YHELGHAFHLLRAEWGRVLPAPITLPSWPALAAARQIQRHERRHEVAVFLLERRREPRFGVDVPKRLDHRLVGRDVDVRRVVYDHSWAVLDIVVLQIGEEQVALLPAARATLVQPERDSQERTRSALSGIRLPDEGSGVVLEAHQLGKERLGTFPHPRAAELRP